MGAWLRCFQGCMLYMQRASRKLCVLLAWHCLLLDKDCLLNTSCLSPLIWLGEWELRGGGAEREWRMSHMFTCLLQPVLQCAQEQQRKGVHSVTLCLSWVQRAMCDCRLQFILHKDANYCRPYDKLLTQTLRNTEIKSLIAGIDKPLVKWHSVCVFICSRWHCCGVRTDAY